MSKKLYTLPDMSFFSEKNLVGKVVFYFSLNKERKFSLLNRSYSIIDFFAKIYENFDTRIEGARSKSLQVRLKSTIWITAKA